MSDYLILSRVTKIYPAPDGPAIIVKDFDLSIRKGEFVCLIGHSGCGKSTVLSMIAGLNEITRGGIILAGRELAGPGPDRGVVFQAPCLLPWLPRRLVYNRFNAWGRQRELPPMPPRSFRQLYRERHGQ